MPIHTTLSEENYVVVYRNLHIHQKTDYISKTFVIRSLDNNLVDLSEYTLHGQVKKTYASTVAWSITIVVDETKDGNFILEIPAAITSELEEGTYVYDIQAQDLITGKTFKLVQGYIHVTPSVTTING